MDLSTQAHSRGINIVPKDVYDHPTIEALSKYILRKNRSTSNSEFITKYSSNGSIPIVMIHTAHSNSSSYLPIIDRIKHNHTIYGIEPVSFYRPDILKSNSIGETAKFYAKLILDNIKSDTYDLLGWSYGALVAYDISIILKKHGKKIRHLYLLDPLL